MYLGSWKIDDYVPIPVTTHRFSSGAAYAPTSLTYSVYEDSTATGLYENVDMVVASPFDSVVGFYLARVQLTALAGFEKGKNYTVLIKATVDSVAAITSHTFQIEAEVDSNVVSGTVATVTNLTNLPSIPNDWITAAGIKSDAIEEIADGVWDEAMAGHVGAGTAGKLAADILEDTGTTLDDFLDTEIAAIKAKTDLITTGTSLSIASVVVGSTITAHRGDSLSAALENIGALTNYSKIWFTVKRDYDDADSAAVVQIEKTDGLKYLNGAAVDVANKTNGSITIQDEATGDVTVALVAAETAKLSPGNYQYDIQILRSAGTPVSTLTYGEFVVAADVTKATS